MLGETVDSCTHPPGCAIAAVQLGTCSAVRLSLALLKGETHVLHLENKGVCVQVIQHGACLGLGLAALGTNDDELFEDIKNVLYLDSAVAGEAAGLALGLLTVGSATDKASDLLAYAHDTQHEKVSVSSFWYGCCRPAPATPCQLLQVHEAEACCWALCVRLQCLT